MTSDGAMRRHPPATGFRRSKLFIASILLLLLYAPCCTSLSEGEKAAVLALRNAIPALAKYWPEPQRVDDICSDPRNDWAGLDCTNGSITTWWGRNIPFNRELPEAISGLVALETLSLSVANVTGTLPASLFRLSRLRNLLLDGNSFQSDLAPFCDLTTLNNLRLAYNGGLVGTIPTCIAELSELEYLDLSNSHISGTIPAELALLRNLVALNLGSTLLTGPLPRWNEIASPLPSLQHLLLSGCAINDVLPWEWHRLESVSIMYDPKMRTLSSIVSKLTDELQISGSNMRGIIPWNLTNPPFGWQNLESFTADHNEFSGPLPAFTSSRTLSSVDLSFNQLSKLPEEFGCGSNRVSKACYLVANNNELTGTIPAGVLCGKLTSVNLAMNHLTGSLPECFGANLNMVELNVSRNHLEGTLHPSPSNTLNEVLKVLDLSHNRLSGDLPATWIYLLRLVITNNSFAFNIHKFNYAFATLTRLEASHNQLFGAATDALGWENRIITRAYINLDNNQLNVSLYWHELNSYFNNGLLFYFSIRNNPRIPHVPYNQTTLHKQDTVYPLRSQNFSCYQLSFSTDTAQPFNYDLDLFGYTQCFCHPFLFGDPAKSPGCQDCPSGPSSLRSLNCTGDASIDVPENYFLYTGDDGKYYFEPCIGATSMLPRKENNPCRPFGFTVGGSSALCRVGSAGHLCSECLCPSNTSETCFFKQSGFCQACKDSITPLFAIVVAVALLVAVVVAIPAFYLIIKSRTTPEKPWRQLSLGKRLLRRLRYLIGLGSVKILIVFVQFAIQLTQWDLFGSRAFVQLFNGQASGFGLRCVLRELYRPVLDFLADLLVPVALVLLMWFSLIISHLITTRCCFRRSQRGQPSLLVQAPETLGWTETDPPGSLIEQSESDIRAYQLLPASSTAKRRWWALGVSMTLSVLDFFYFGVSATALQAFLSVPQPHTSNYWSSSYPWIPWSDPEAVNMRYIAIPYTILIVVGVPLAKMVILWLIGSRLEEVVVKDCFGGLYEAFKEKMYWWSIVLQSRKALLGLAIVAVPSFPQVAPLVVISLLVAYLAIQISLQPWKRSTDNFFEQGASLVLITAFYITSFGVAQPAFSDDIAIYGRTLVLVYVSILVIYSIWRAYVDEMPGNEPSKIARMELGAERSEE